MPNGWVIDFMIMMKTRLVYQLYFWKGQKNGFREFVRNSRLKITSYISIRLCIMTEIKPFTLNLDAWNKNNIGFEWIDFNLWWYYTLILYRIQQFHISTLHFFHIYSCSRIESEFFFVCLCVIKWTSVERLHSLYTHPEHKHRQLHWIMTYIRAPATATKRWNHLHTKRVVVNICNGMCILVFVCVCVCVVHSTGSSQVKTKRLVSALP